MEPLTLTLPPEALEQLEQRITARILASLEAFTAASPYLDVEGAARFLSCGKQRIYDIVHQGALEPSRDGKRLLFRRDQLAAYVEGRTA